MVTTIKNNVSFSNYVNGHETVYFGIGKSITLSNGNQYAIIDGIKYKVILRGDNNQELVEMPMKIKYYLFEGKGKVASLKERESGVCYDLGIDIDYTNFNEYSQYQYNQDLPSLGKYKEIEYSLSNEKGERCAKILVCASDAHNARMIALKYEEEWQVWY